MDPHRPKVPGRFYTPYINAKFIFPAMVVLGGMIALMFYPDGVNQFFTYGDWESFKGKIPLLGFLVLIVYLSIRSFTKNLSLIPLMGVTSCGYLMTELGWTNWVRFGIWLVVGLSIYFLYSRKNSKLNGA